MNTADLGELAAELVGSHAGYRWSVLSPGGPDSDLRAEIRAVDDPSRMAVLWIRAGAEVFHVQVWGHEDTDLAYEDEERVEVLQERIGLAMAALRGPTQVTIWRAGDQVIRSRLVLTDGTHEWQGQDVDRRLARVVAWFRGQRVVEQHIVVQAIREP